MNLVLAITGATGVHAARLLMERSPWPVTLVASDWGKNVCRSEGCSFTELSEGAAAVYQDTDLSATIASGSVPTAGMVILPCTTNALGKIAAGLADTLITRAAHCHLKERRKLLLCVRETPWTLIDIRNAERVSAAGGVVMPLSPPFYMAGERSPDSVTMSELLGWYVDRVLATLGQAAERNWQDLKKE